MKRILYIFFSLIIFNASASNEWGNSITIKNLGAGIYLVRFVQHYDCAAAPPAQITVYYDYNGNPADSVITQIAQDTTWNSTLCFVNQPGNCAGGYGIQKYTYEGIVSLPSNGIYRFYRKLITLPGSPPSEYTYVEAKLSIGAFLQNSLPEFTSNPEFYFCVSVPAIYNDYATDIDGDSIIYSVSPILTLDSVGNGPVSYLYIIPESPGNFTLTMTSLAAINQHSGTLTFTPATVDTGAILMVANEYRNGVWIGSVMRESRAMVTLSTGMDESTGSINVIYPNPSSDKVKIAGMNVQMYSIADLSGRQLKNGVPDEQIIDISMLPPGVYILSLQSYATVHSCKLIRN